METKIQNYNSKHGFEIAIHSQDSGIKGCSRILEGLSTTGFKEVPPIQYPDQFKVSNHIIQFDQDWVIEFIWEVYGPFACFLTDGSWHCKVYFELFGEGETSFSPEAETLSMGEPGHKYQLQLKVKSGELKPGVYRVVSCLQYCFKNGDPGPIVGFQDLGLIKIYMDKNAWNRAEQSKMTQTTNGSL